ncbi:hypothetical protein DBP18_10620 [Streptomyces sp. CS081A]|nr:hypothetical protein DBP18_10620 [Streptomyces sp. CS081A]
MRNPSSRTTRTGGRSATEFHITAASSHPSRSRPAPGEGPEPRAPPATTAAVGPPAPPADRPAALTPCDPYHRSPVICDLGTHGTRR